MVLRLLIRFLANNEQLVQRLSQSYPIQVAARFTASIFFRGKGIVEEHKLAEKLDPAKLSTSIKRFSQNFQKELKQAQEEYNQKKK